MTPPTKTWSVSKNLAEVKQYLTVSTYAGYIRGFAGPRKFWILKALGPFTCPPPGLVVSVLMEERFVFSTSDTH